MKLLQVYKVQQEHRHLDVETNWPGLGILLGHQFILTVFLRKPDCWYGGYMAIYYPSFLRDTTCTLEIQ